MKRKVTLVSLFCSSLLLTACGGGGGGGAKNQDPDPVTPPDGSDTLKFDPSLAMLPDYDRSKLSTDDLSGLWLMHDRIVFQGMTSVGDHPKTTREQVVAQIAKLEKTATGYKFSPCSGETDERRKVGMTVNGNQIQLDSLVGTVSENNLRIDWNNGAIFSPVLNFAKRADAKAKKTSGYAVKVRDNVSSVVGTAVVDGERIDINCPRQNWKSLKLFEGGTSLSTFLQGGGITLTWTDTNILGNHKEYTFEYKEGKAEQKLGLMKNGDSRPDKVAISWNADERILPNKDGMHGNFNFEMKLEMTKVFATAPPPPRPPVSN